MSMSMSIPEGCQCGRRTNQTRGQRPETRPDRQGRQMLKCCLVVGGVAWFAQAFRRATSQSILRGLFNGRSYRMTMEHLRAGAASAWPTVADPSNASVARNICIQSLQNIRTSFLSKYIPTLISTVITLHGQLLPSEQNIFTEPTPYCVHLHQQTSASPPTKIAPVAVLRTKPCNQTTQHNTTQHPPPLSRLSGNSSQTPDTGHTPRSRCGTRQGCLDPWRV